MSAAAVSLEPVLVRVVPYSNAKRVNAGSVLNFGDGLAVVAKNPQYVSAGIWLHTLLYLSGEEYSGARPVALQILSRARAAFAANPSAEEIPVKLPATL